MTIEAIVAFGKSKLLLINMFATRIRRDTGRNCPYHSRLEQLNSFSIPTFLRSFYSAMFMVFQQGKARMKEAPFLIFFKKCILLCITARSPKVSPLLNYSHSFVQKV